MRDYIYRYVFGFFLNLRLQQFCHSDQHVWRAAFCSRGTEGDPVWMGSVSKVSANHGENRDDYLPDPVWAAFHPALLSSDGLHGFFDFRRFWACNLWAIVDGDPGKGVRIIAMWLLWSCFKRHQSRSHWAKVEKVQWQLSLLQLKKWRFMVLGLVVWIVHVELFMGQAFPFLTYWIFLLLFLFHVNFSFIVHLIVFSWMMFPSRKVHVSRIPALRVH